MSEGAYKVIPFPVHGWPARVLDLNPADKAMLETRRMAEAELWRAFRLPTLGIGLADEVGVAQ